MSDQQTARVARRLTQHERARVWERVVAERAKGDGWRDIAERAALSERQCRRIYLAYARSAPTLERSELERQIDEAIAGFDADDRGIGDDQHDCSERLDTGAGDPLANQRTIAQDGAVENRGRAWRRAGRA